MYQHIAYSFLIDLHIPGFSYLESDLSFKVHGTNEGHFPGPSSRLVCRRSQMISPVL